MCSDKGCQDGDWTLRPLPLRPLGPLLEKTLRPLVKTFRSLMKRHFGPLAEDNPPLLKKKEPNMRGGSVFCEGLNYDSLLRQAEVFSARGRSVLTRGRSVSSKRGRCDRGRSVQSPYNITYIFGVVTKRLLFRDII